jgi:hypothetical protein
MAMLSRKKSTPPELFGYGRVKVLYSSVGPAGRSPRLGHAGLCEVRETDRQNGAKGSIGRDGGAIPVKRSRPGVFAERPAAPAERRVLVANLIMRLFILSDGRTNTCRLSSLRCLFHRFPFKPVHWVWREPFFLLNPVQGMNYIRTTAFLTPKPSGGPFPG